MTGSSSVVGGWAVAVRRALTSMGYDASTLLKQAGLSPDRAVDPNARPSSENTRELWRLAVEETGRPDIGLEVAKFVGPTTFHALGFSLWASSTLLEAMQKMVRFESLLNEGCSLQLLERGDEVWLQLIVHDAEDGSPAVAPQGVDYFFGAVVNMFRNIGESGFSPLRVCFRHSPPSDVKAYERYFDAPVMFDTESNTLCCARNDLTRILPTANPELAQENDRVVSDYMSRLVLSDIVSQVRAAILEILPLGDPTHQRVAEALRLHPRTLQYRLSRAGTNYKQLIDDIRRELALQYLKLSHYSVTEIAYLLGYSDPSHFNRAFRRWQGCSPGQYRAPSR